MSQWRREAIQRFPEMHRAISELEGSFFVWRELRQRLQRVYRTLPFDDDYVRRVYEYAHWCLHHRSRDVRYAVLDAFYEDLVADRSVAGDMARWVSVEDFKLLDSVWQFANIDEKEREAFERDFFERKQRMSRSR